MMGPYAGTLLSFIGSDSTPLDRCRDSADTCFLSEPAEGIMPVLFSVS